MNKRVQLAIPQPCRGQGEPEGSRRGQRDWCDTDALQKRNPSRCSATDLLPEGERNHRPRALRCWCRCVMAGQGAVQEAAESKPLFLTYRMGLRSSGLSRQDW